MKTLKNYILEATKDERHILYGAIMLNDASKSEIRNYAIQQIGKLNNFDPEYKCDHMLISVGNKLTDDMRKWCIDHENSEIKMTAIRVGSSDKAIAIEVETQAPCQNIRKHITLAVNKITDGQSKDSNNIQSWIPIENKMELQGTVKIIE